jgi:hypothetical protein
MLRTSKGITLSVRKETKYLRKRDLGYGIELTFLSPFKDQVPDPEGILYKFGPIQIRIRNPVKSLFLTITKLPAMLTEIWFLVGQCYFFATFALCSAYSFICK